MNILHFQAVIYISIISSQNFCTAWVLPMMKHSAFQNNKNAKNLQVNATVEDSKDVMGIQIIKFTREDPTMQIFDFDMDLARKFAYSEWQKLLDDYVPVPDMQVEEYTQRVPARELTNSVSQRPPSKFIKIISPAKLEYDEDSPQHVAQAMQYMQGGVDIHQGLK